MGAPQIHPVVMDDHDLVLKPWWRLGIPPCLLGPHACHRWNAWSCTYHLSWGTRNGATRLLFQMCYGCQGQLKYFYGHPTIRIRFTIIWFDELLIPVMNMDWWPSSQYGCIIQVSTVAQMMMGIYWEHSPFSDTHTYIYIYPGVVWCVDSNYQSFS